MAVPRGGQEPLPLKVAPIQPSVTAAFHLQSRRDSDCQMWELYCVYHQDVLDELKIIGANMVKWRSIYDKTVKLA